MPLIAEAKKQSGEWSKRAIYNYPRDEIRKWRGIVEFRCQSCHRQMMVKCGLLVRPHFAHYKSNDNCDYLTKGESAEHLAAKELMMGWLQKRKEYEDCKFTLEYFIKDINRIADIAVFTFQDVLVEVHEIQLSSITTEQLMERTNDYAKAGIEVTWWLGGSAETPKNRAFSSEYFGYTGIIKLSNTNELKM